MSSINEIKKILKHAEQQYEKSVMPEDVKHWREKITMIKDQIKNREELINWKNRY